MTNNDPAQRLADAVKARREELQLNQLQVAAGGGPSNTLQTEIENGRLGRLTPKTAEKIDAGMMWEAGSAMRIWEAKGQATPRGLGVTSDGSLWMSDHRREMQLLRHYVETGGPEGLDAEPPSDALALWDFEQLIHAALLKYRDETELLNHLLRVARTRPKAGGEKREDHTQEQEPTRHLGVAANDEDHDIEDEQGHDETP